MKKLTLHCSLLFLAVAILTWCATAHCQVPVAIAPNPHPQFLNSSGGLLSGGFLYTYQAGTTTLLNTYVDSTGTIQNPDPIPLDATGAPSNGSTQTGIWLANQSYKICGYNSALVQQWCTDNLTGYLGLLNTPNTWTFQQTFLLPIDDTQTDNQLVLGSAGNLTTLDFPPPSANITLHMPNTGDTMVGRNTTDTLTNKSLTTPTVNNVPIVNNPGTYISLGNASPTGTVANALAILGGTGISYATVATTSTASGVLGICVSGCGTGGAGVIQQSGIVSCIFDGATTFNDAVVPSTITGGDCHDSGNATASNSIGNVLASNGTAGVWGMLLSTGSGGRIALCSSGTPVTVNANTTSNQIIETCPFPAGVLNLPGKSFRLTTTVIASQASSGTNSVIFLGMGTTSALGTNASITSFTGAATSFDSTISATCAVTTAGSSGVITCSSIPIVQSGSGTTSISGTGVYFQLTGLNLTGAFYVGSICSFSAASASNSCVGNPFVVEQLN